MNTDKPSMSQYANMTQYDQAVKEWQAERIAELEAEVEQLKANQSSVKARMITLSEERLYSIVDALFHEFASNERCSARVSLALKIKSLENQQGDDKPQCMECYGDISGNGVLAQNGDLCCSTDCASECDFDAGRDNQQDKGGEL